MSNQTTTIDGFYSGVMQRGNLRTPDHAARLTFAVLHALGFNLNGGTKRKLAKALPDALARDLTRGWRLLNIRRSKLPLRDFAQDVARNSGNTDPIYAEMATKVVFHQIKQIIDDDLVREVAKGLSPEVGDFWSAA